MNILGIIAKRFLHLFADDSGLKLVFLISSTNTTIESNQILQRRLMVFQLKYLIFMLNNLQKIRFKIHLKPKRNNEILRKYKNYGLGSGYNSECERHPKVNLSQSAVNILFKMSRNTLLKKPFSFLSSWSFPSFFGYNLPCPLRYIIRL